MAYWRQIHPTAKRIVLHPSHAVARRLVRQGELTQTRRRHPVFRWHANLPPETEQVLLEHLKLPKPIE
jgi:hypothetical protein